MQYMDAMRLIATVCRNSLSTNEIVTLLFINDRTLRFNKRRERVPFRHFSEGVFDAEGTLITSPVALSRTTLYRALESLEQKGLVRVDRAKGENPVVEIDPDALLLFAESCNMSKLKEPKRAKKVDEYDREDGKVVSKLARGCFNLKQLDVSNLADISIENNKEVEIRSKNISAASAGSKASVTFVVEQVKQRSRLKVEAKAEGVDYRPTLQNISAAWKAAMVDKFSGTVVTAVTRREFGIFKRTYEKNTLPLPLSEFIPWAVENWAELRTNELSWCDRMPHLPSLGFFAGMLFHFAKAHSETVVRKQTNEAKLQRRGRATSRTLQEAETTKLQLVATERQLAESQREKDHLRRMLQETNARKTAAPLSFKMRHTHELDYASIEPLPE